MTTARTTSKSHEKAARNRLQALFLDKSYQHAFMLVARPYVDELEGVHIKNQTEITRKIDEAIQTCRGHDAEAAAWAALRKSVEESKPELEPHTPLFEYQGADVRIHVTATTPGWRRDRGSTPDNAVAWRLVAPGLGPTLSITIKPAITDDYPTVLRQMIRSKTQYLFVDRYEAQGATREQFVAMFAASGKRVVFKRDVDAALVSPEVTATEATEILGVP